MLNYVEIKGTIEVLEDMHIGSGKAEDNKSLFEAKVDLEKNNLNTVIRGIDDKLLIPGSSFKGSLRRSFANICKDKVLMKHLFGVSHDDSGNAGAMLFQDAFHDVIPEKAKDLPTNTRIAIDRNTGATKHGALFTNEMVPKGTTFDLDWTYAPIDSDDIENKFKKNVIPLLNHMASGFSLGQGTKVLQGKVKLKNHTCHLHELNCMVRDIKDDTSSDSNEETTTNYRTYSFTLNCPGPYLSVDPTKKTNGEKKNKTDPDLVALRNEKDEPLIPGTSLLGALRAASARHESMKCDISQPDNLDKVLKAGDDPFDKLTYTERLFGVTGWKGLIELEEIKYIEPVKSKKITGVPIDRFTGGTLDSGTIVVDANIDCNFQIKIRLQNRGLKKSLIAKNRLFLKELFAALKGKDGEGLFLGWGAARGYGWFEINDFVEKVEAQNVR